MRKRVSQLANPFSAVQIEIFMLYLTKLLFKPHLFIFKNSLIH